MPIHLCLSSLLLLLAPFCVGEVAVPGRVPKGDSPLLYDPAQESILHLDADSFEDTVLNAHRDRALLVEFYKDWCGYCRRFAPFLKVFSESVSSWPFVQVAAINCADPFNMEICRANDIRTVPVLKYFARSAHSLVDSQVIEHPYDSAMELRELLHRKMVDEFHSEMGQGRSNYYLSNGMAYEGKCEHDASLWAPNSAEGCAAGDDAATFSHLQHDPWAGVSNSTEYLVTTFERQIDMTGLQFAMELLLFKPQVEVRRVLVSGDVRMDAVLPSGAELPYLVALRRGSAHPLMAESVNEETLPSFRAMLEPMMQQLNETEQAEALAKKPVQTVVDCASQPDKCKQMFHVSESDMLKAMHMALWEEVISSGGDQLDEARTVALQNFLDLLIKRFPRKTLEGALPQHQLSASSSDLVAVFASSGGKPLSRSQRAGEVFGHLRRVLDAKSNISMDEWSAEFEAAKAQNGGPFPVDAEWEHCRGTLPIYRGFTCGLWTTFHALTVQAYLCGEREPLAPLEAIRGWVRNLFSCAGCRKNFDILTTEKIPMDSTNVKGSQDVVLYLWRAHNFANRRLHGEETFTEDPQFPKQHFPPQFLCPECTAKLAHSEEPDEESVLRFLLQFATNIKPSP